MNNFKNTTGFPRIFVIDLDTTYLELNIEKVKNRFFWGVSIIEIHDIQAPSSVPSCNPSISPTDMPSRKMFGLQRNLWYTYSVLFCNIELIFQSGTDDMIRFEDLKKFLMK